MSSKHRPRISRVLIICGILAAGLSSLPLPSHAAPASEVELWLGQEFIAGDPGPGEKGSLYEQLQLKVEAGGNLLFAGNLCELDRVNISDKIGPVAPGARVQICFTMHLPGVETDNQCQGASLETRFIIYAKARDEGEIHTGARSALFSLGNLNPGDTYQECLELTFKKKYLPPELPVTGGAPGYIWAACGLSMIIVGIAVGWQGKR